METNIVIQGDALGELKKIPDGSIDCIVTDPPYAFTWKDRIWLKGRDTGFVNKPKFEEGFNISQFEEIYEEFNRILREGGSLLMFVRPENVSYFLKYAEDNNFKHKAFICWHKTNPVPQVRKKQYLSSCEYIIWQTKGFHKKVKYAFNFKTQKEMHNFIEMPFCQGKERTEHPTQKPLKLVKHLIEIHTNPNELILDCFAGSGTTAVACLELERNFIIIERDSKYCDIARKRIQPLLEQRKL